MPPKPMNADIRISKAAEQDAEAISALAAEIWNACYPGIITREQIDYMLGWMYRPEKIRTEMREESIVYLRADAPKGMVGFAAFGPGSQAGDVFIHKLYIDRQIQGQGIGTRVLGEIEARCRARGDHRISLRVNRNNLQAIGAYEKSGFRKKGEICSDIGGGFIMDDFEMGKELL